MALPHIFSYMNGRHGLQTRTTGNPHGVYLDDKSKSNSFLTSAWTSLMRVVLMLNFLGTRSPRIFFVAASPSGVPGSAPPEGSSIPEKIATEYFPGIGLIVLGFEDEIAFHQGLAIQFYGSGNRYARIFVAAFATPRASQKADQCQAAPYWPAYRLCARVFFSAI
jgi:hypothetical protein